MDTIQRQTILHRYAAAYTELTDALAKFPKEMWDYRPAPREWNVHEVIIHITDSEANSFVRARRAIAEPGASVMSYDEDRWSRTLFYGQQSTDVALNLFGALRGATYALLQLLPEAAWANTIQHPQNGRMTLDDWLVVYADHIPLHINQMRQNYRHWQASKGE